MGNIVYWLPNQIKKVFAKKRHHKNISTKKATGYILFNQPKYKLTDTVKLKSFLLDKKNKPLKEALNVWLSYYAKGKSQNQLLHSNLLPVTSGSYVYEFALNDTLANDVSYKIQFKTQKNEDVYAGNFRTGRLYFKRYC